MVSILNLDFSHLTFFDRTTAPEMYAMQDMERGGAIEYNEYNSLQIQINSEPINP